METSHLTEIDTGPGLEAQFSWDYSHAKLAVDPLGSHETRSSQKTQQHVEEPHSASAGDEL